MIPIMVDALVLLIIVCAPVLLIMIHASVLLLLPFAPNMIIKTMVTDVLPNISISVIVFVSFISVWVEALEQH